MKLLDHKKLLIIQLTSKVEGVEIPMHIDTGSAVTLLKKQDFLSKDITIRVVDGPGQSLLGRDLMEKIILPWKSIFKIRVMVEDVMKDCADLFDTKTVGKLEGVQVSLRVNDENPLFMKARTVPFAIRERYEKAK